VGYIDVTEGRFAKLKRRIKRKLLHQFQTADVDVLSRQQSAFNQSVLTAVRELNECAASLEQAVMTEERPPQPALANLLPVVERLKEQVRRAVGRMAILEQRLERLESRVSEARVESCAGGRA
jgi:hypothetical protein